MSKPIMDWSDYNLATVTTGITPYHVGFEDGSLGSPAALRRSFANESDFNDYELGYFDGRESRKP